MNNIGKHKTASHRQRAGFTLIELLVVVLVLLLLAGMTFTAVNVTMDAERIGIGARQLQSYLEGARNRAAYAKQPRGVRFLPDANNPSVASSMVFIGPPELFSEGAVTITNSGASNPDLAYPGVWSSLYSRGLLVDGARIRIEPNGTGTRWYTLIITDNGSGGIANIRLSRTNIKTGIEGLPVPYELQLQPTVLPNQEPRQFAKGVVLDLTNSQPGGVQDILFSPNGTIYGTAAAHGRIYFLLTDLVDVTKGLLPGEGYKSGETDPLKIREGDERIITVTTKTGSVITFPVKQKIAGTENAFEFAETGVGGS